MIKKKIAPKEKVSQARRIAFELQDSKGRLARLPEHKKDRENTKIKGFRLVDKTTGEIISRDISPKFENFGSYEEYAKHFSLYIEAMSAKELEGNKLEEYKDNLYVIAEEKFDGHRALDYITMEGMRKFSKRISKATNWFSENTDTMPHLRDFLSEEKRRLLNGTILDEEITTDLVGSSSTDVQSIAGSKPVNALYAQMTDKGFAVPYIFDILYYKRVRLENAPLALRKLFAFKAFIEIDSPYIRFSKMYVLKDSLALDLLKTTNEKYEVLSDGEFSEFSNYVIKTKSFEDLFDSMLSLHKEGLMLKDLTREYVHKESDAFVKMKEHSTFDVVVTGYDPPEKYYTGKELENPVFTWIYWEDKKGKVIHKKMTMWDAVATEHKPLTKFYALGMFGALKYGVYKNGKLIDVGRCSGFTDEDREQITKTMDSIVASKEVIEVEAQGFSDKTKGTLRHPRFVRFRGDKSAEQCTWEKHLRL